MTESLRVVSVIGGYGIFGGRIAQALARDRSCKVGVLGRNAEIGGNFAHLIGAEFRRCDISDRDSLRQAIDGSFLVIHAAGPFQGADHRVAELCLEVGGALPRPCRRADSSPASGDSTPRPGAASFWSARASARHPRSPRP